MNGTGYQTTKFRAEQYLANSGMDWTVFRPSVIFGDPRGRMEFATQLYREVICSPLPAPLFFKGLRPTEAGMFRMSPVHVRDVATAFVQALDMPETAGRTYTLGGPENPTWKAILHTIAHACGYDKSEKPVLPVPALALHGLAALLDRYAFFPVTRDQLTMLLEGNVCDGRVAFDTFGIEPVAFAAENLAYLRKAPRFRTAP
jgi:NADH dehydrogenase